MMSRTFWVLLAALSVTVAAQATDCAHANMADRIISAITPTWYSNYILTTNGLGKVRLGMTVRMAEKALNKKFIVYADDDPSGGCVYAQRADKRDPEIAYMVLDGVISRIEIGRVKKSPVRAVSGLGIGATEKEVKRIYGQRVIVRPDFYDAQHERDLVIDNATHSSGMSFHVEDGRVTGLMVGSYPALAFVEGCD